MSGDSDVGRGLMCILMRAARPEGRFGETQESCERLSRELRNRSHGAKAHRVEPARRSVAL